MEENQCVVCYKELQENKIPRISMCGQQHWICIEDYSQMAMMNQQEVLSCPICRISCPSIEKVSIQVVEYEVQKIYSVNFSEPGTRAAHSIIEYGQFGQKTYHRIKIEKIGQVKPQHYQIQNYFYNNLTDIVALILRPHDAQFITKIAYYDFYIRYIQQDAKFVLTIKSINRKKQEQIEEHKEEEILQPF